LLKVNLATVLPGAKPFKENNVNDTFSGQILTDRGDVRGAIIKDINIRELANELIAGVLARAIGLPIPDFFLAVVKGADLEIKKGPVLSDGNRLVFASADVKVPNLSYRIKSTFPNHCQILGELIDWRQLGSLYAFDAWVANVDRHPGNLLLGGQGEIWLIDHGYCLSGPNWAAIDLVPNIAYRNRLSEWLTGCLTPSQRNSRISEADDLMATAKTIDLAELPENSHAVDFLSDADLKAAQDFLSERINYIPQEAGRALGLLT